MKKLLIVLAALVACSAMVVETKNKCCKKACKTNKCCKKTSCAQPCEKTCEKSCPQPLCCTRTEKRCVEVDCPRIIEKQIPREVWTSHIEYDTVCETVIDKKIVEQTRQVCEANETEWVCKNGECCGGGNCPNGTCQAFRANPANAEKIGRVIAGSEEVVA